MAVAHSADRGDVCLASERSIKWRASGISETSNPRPKAFSASRFDLVLPAQMSLFSVGEYRWTRTGIGHLVRSFCRWLGGWQDLSGRVLFATKTQEERTECENWFSLHVVA
jgi:hypothetical protein